MSKSEMLRNFKKIETRYNKIDEEIFRETRIQTRPRQNFCMSSGRSPKWSSQGCRESESLRAPGPSEKPSPSWLVLSSGLSSLCLRSIYGQAPWSQRDREWSRWWLQRGDRNRHTKKRSHWHTLLSLARPHAAEQESSLSSRELWSIVSFMELVHFIKVIKIVRIQWFIIVFYYFVNVHGICSGGPSFMPDIEFQPCNSFFF